MRVHLTAGAARRRLIAIGVAVLVVTGGATVGGEEDLPPAAGVAETAGTAWLASALAPSSGTTAPALVAGAVLARAGRVLETRGCEAAVPAGLPPAVATTSPTAPPVTTSTATTMGTRRRRAALVVRCTRISTAGRVGPATAPAWSPAPGR